MRFIQFKAIFLVLITSILVSGCDSESLIPKEKVIFESEQLVQVESEPDAKIYHWKQVSGPKVSIPNKKISTLEFTAPIVDKDTTMTFELKAVFDWKIRDIMFRDTVEIKIVPILIINGFRLPPEPDPEENNATLLGIDSNNNGVRDDVERWIYQTYKDKHPIHIDIAMQKGRAWQKVMEAPTSMAKTTVGFVHAAIDCEAYYQIYAAYFNDKVLVKEDISTKWKVLNTKHRKSAFLAYDKALSGGVYTLADDEKMKEMCDFEVEKYKE